MTRSGLVLASLVLVGSLVGSGGLVGCGGKETRPDDPLSPRYALAMRAGSRGIAIGNTNTAVVGYRRAITEAEIQANPDRQAAAWYALAGALARTGDTDGSLDAIGEAKMLGAMNTAMLTNALLLESAVHAEVGNGALSMSALEEARSLLPEDALQPSPEFLLAEARAMVASGKLEDANQTLDVLNTPESASVLKLRGTILSLRGSHAEAAATFEQAALAADDRIDPILNIDMLRMAAISFAASGDHAVAATHALVAGRGYVAANLRSDRAKECFELALESGSAAGRDDIVAAANRGLERFAGG